MPVAPTLGHRGAADDCPRSTMSEAPRSRRRARLLDRFATSSGAPRRRAAARHRPARGGAPAPRSPTRTRRDRRLRELVDDRAAPRRTPYEAVTRRPSSSSAAGGEPRPAPGRGAAGHAVRRPPARSARRCCRHGCASRCATPRLARRRSCAGSASTGSTCSAATPALARRIDLALDVLAEEARALRAEGAGDHFGGPIVGRDARLSRASSRTPWLLERHRLDAARRAAGQVDVRLARAAVAGATAGADPTLADVPDEELDRWPGGGHRAVADRAVAAESRLRRRSSAAAATTDAVASAYAHRRLPDRGRPRRRGGLRGRCSGAQGPAASGWRPTWSRTTWASIRAGWSSTRSGSSRSPSRPTPRTRSAARTSRRTSRVEITLEDHYWDGTRRGGRLPAARRAERRGAVHLPRQRRHVVPVERHGPARLPQPRGPRSGHPARSSTSRAARRSSGSTPRWSWRASTSAGSGIRSRAPAGRSRRVPSTRSRAREFNRADAQGVLARGRGPGRGRGAGHAPPRRGVLAARGLLRADPRHAPRLQLARSCTCSATRTTRATARSCATRSSSTRRSSGGS